ncbi:MAG: hypothetical protein KBC95_03365 [Candidatus Peribacteraceae bacterium]|nr:hypothetical protein [Candidatus Peribacteraceae bacterium]
MDDTLFLTPDEQARFGTLPEALRQGRLVETESSTAFESDEQLEIRRQLASFKDDPTTVALADAIAAGKPAAEWPEVPQSVLPELYFTIGARGVTAMIGALLGEMADGEDVDLLAALSFIRHELFGTNEAIPSPAAK